MRRLAFALLLAALVLVVERRAQAIPLFTPLSQIGNEATSIVIGTMTSDLEIDVDTVIRGTVGLGPHTMVADPDGAPHERGRVLAMIDKANTFRWVGELEAGPTIEGGVLFFKGFYDMNASVVSPTIMTLAQFKDFLNGGTALQHQRFVVEIDVEDPSLGAAYVPSGETFRLDYDAVNKRTTGSSGFRGRCLRDPQISMIEVVGNLNISFQDACASLGQAARREFELTGNPIRLEATGEIVLSTLPIRPFLDKQDFPRYFNDGDFVDVHHMIELKLVDGTKWWWDAGNGLIDPHNKVYEAKGFGYSAPTETFDFKDASVSLTNASPKTAAPGGYPKSLIEWIDTNTYGKCTFKSKGRPARGCTLGRGSSTFIKR